MANYKDLFIAKNFDDTDRVQKLISHVFEEFKTQHKIDGPVISPDFSIKYKDLPLKVDIPVKCEDAEDVIKKIIPFFGNCINWGAPGAMFNVTPPVNIVGVAINVLTSLLNPNLAEDRSGGLTAYAEQEVIKCLGRLLKWDESNVTGHSCFGGKATNLYASRNAIAICKEALEETFDIKNSFYISSELGHPCQTEGVSLQGLSKDNNVVIPCDNNGKFNLKLLESEIDKRLSQGQFFLGLTLNAGTTMEYVVDDIKKIVDIRNKMQKKYNLPYKPQIHGDAVLGWVWLFMEKINEVTIHNKNIKQSSIDKALDMYSRIKDLSLVDSIGVDFHKLGYTSYQSSFYVSQTNGKSFVDDLGYGQLSTYNDTIELSRGAQGVMGALGSLLSFGYEGYVNIILNLVNSVDVLRERLSEHPMLEALYPESLGVCNVVVITHKKPLNKNISPEDLKTIHGLNQSFISFLKRKIEAGEASFFTWFSKSYLVPGDNIRYGGLKLYGTSPHLEKENLDNFISDFFKNVDEFLQETDFCNVKKVSDSETNIGKEDSYHPIF